ncbi:glycosyltransferase [Rudaea cellulosilytica]|uniref:glycosyltransferase n=1 Tax=Rudaea cellulosilytica TaxID=540746 RepID=UPI00039DF7CF|nr:glycosyltransferase [Rudaea cellulosilytica]
MNLHVAFDTGIQQRDILRRAAALLQTGEGEQARRALQTLRAEHIRDLEEAVVAVNMLLDVNLPDAALAMAVRMGGLAPGHPECAELMAECRFLIDRPTFWQNESRDIRTALEQISTLASTAEHAATDSKLHILCNLDSIGGSERRALNLYRFLSAHMPTTLWSTAPAHPAHREQAPIRLIHGDETPSGGTIVLIGTYYDIGDLLERGHFERVVICHNLIDQNQNLLRWLKRIGNNPAHPSVELTFPSKMFGELLGLPGAAEYSPVDLAHFRCRQARASTPDIAVGRHSRAYAYKFHYNDAAFFRQAIAHGYRVRLLGGNAIERVFAADKGKRPELIAEGAVEARDFLETLDVFVYRKHPQWLETGGAVILEAMAMELPVIIFPEQCGCAELIVHGENGFLVASETEAFEILARLSAEPDLRRRIGSAARQTLVDLQRRQEPELLARYRG